MVFIPYMNTGILWTEDERTKIADEYIRLYGEQEPKDKHVKETARAILSEDRWRDHISPNDPVKRLIAEKQNRPFHIKRNSSKRFKAVRRRVEGELRPQQPPERRNRALYKRAIGIAMLALQLAAELDNE